MKIIKLDKILIDGRLMQYHRPTESIFNTDNTMTVKLGSWIDLESVFAPPAAISDTNMPLIDQNDIMEYIVTLPGWEGSVILNNSITKVPDEPTPEQLERREKQIQKFLRMQNTAT